MCFLLTAHCKFLPRVEGLQYITENGQVLTSDGRVTLDQAKER